MTRHLYNYLDEFIDEYHNAYKSLNKVQKLFYKWILKPIPSYYKLDSHYEIIADLRYE